MSTKRERVFDMILRRRKGLGDKLLLEILEQVKEYISRSPEEAPVKAQALKCKGDGRRTTQDRQFLPSEVRELKKDDPEKHRLVMRIRDAIRRGRLDPGKMSLGVKSKKDLLSNPDINATLVELAGKSMADLERLMEIAGLSTGRDRHRERHYDQLADSLMNARKERNGTRKGPPEDD